MSFDSMRPRGLPGRVRATAGASLLEYIILVATIGLLALVGFRVFGGTVAARAEADATCVAALDGGCAGQAANPAGAAPAPPSAAPPAGGQRAGFWSGFGSQLKDDLVGTVLLVASATPPWELYSAITGTPNRFNDTVSWAVKFTLSATPPGRLVALGGGPDPFGDTVRNVSGRVADQWNGNRREFLGRAAAEAVFFAVPLVKVGKAAELAEAAADVSKAAGVAEKAEAVEAGSLARAGEIEAAATPARRVFVNVRTDQTFPAELIEIEGGRVVNSASDVLEAARASRDGQIVFIEKANGELWVGPAQMGHSLLSGGFGGEVVAAGEAEIDVATGQGVWISDRSGTFFGAGQQGSKEALDFAWQKFKDRGIDFSQYKPPQ